MMPPPGASTCPHCGFPESASALRIARRYREPARGLRERVVRDGAQVALGHELLQRPRIAAGVGIVLVERIAHQREVLLEDRFLGAAYPAHIVRNDDGKKQG